MTDTTELPVRPSSFEDLQELVGKEIGPTDWYTVSQERIDAFAAATGDDQWIHVDPARAAASPLGTTIAHGLFSLALGPAFSYRLLSFEGFAHGLNYGYDKLRFIAPVQAGDRIRITAVPSEIAPHARGSVVRVGLTVEIERGAQIALVGDQLLFVFAAGRSD